MVQPVGQLRGDAIRCGAPLPVASQRGGNIHPRLAAQAQQVLHRQDDSITRALQRPAHHAPVGALRFGQAQVLPRKPHILRGCRMHPSHYGIIIVGTGVYHTVPGVIVRQIVTVLPAIKGELQHLHAREATLLSQTMNSLRQKAQVLRNDGQITQRGPHRMEQFNARALPPHTVTGSGGPAGNGIITLKPTEMVNTVQSIEKTALASYYTANGTNGTLNEGKEKINVYVFCNPTQRLQKKLTDLKYGVDWIDEKGQVIENADGTYPNSSTQDGGAVWGGSDHKQGFLMATAKSNDIEKGIPKTLSGWDNHNTAEKAFD